ncbi:SIS domain-containing protein [Vagococcus elongatus]|uniref:Adhesin n=1 Tax=Vagococcus elongatus TaxID=180344 RepID=A0A430APD8_9ENTE|nr:SIS domain-containing protein [Vagococcus elongatus]RSU10008.1 adhesin [Vagococcus elongatus]
MEIFAMNHEILKEKKAVLTAKEIKQQPKVWRKTLDILTEQKEELEQFIQKIVNQREYQIIFTGAGTSEFIGNALVHSLKGKYDGHIFSYASTEIVSAPESYLPKTKPVLLVSFARSGDSPESLGSVSYADEICENIHHLFITCNKQGKLAKYGKDKGNIFTLLLPDETLDKGFAMTSSFSCMYLSAYVSLNLENFAETKDQVEKIIPSVTNLIEEDYSLAKKIIEEFQFKRIIYLGSNTLKGISQESQLKMLELTQGAVVTMYDSLLGFRHGPKSAITSETLLIIYLSDNEFSRKYEIDFLNEVISQKNGYKLCVLYNQQLTVDSNLVDYNYCYEIDEPLDNVYLGLCYIIFAQILALYKSMDVGIGPDDPCPSGKVNRVVKGVTIYPLNNA